jgi:hypothetical protein
MVSAGSFLSAVFLGRYLEPVGYSIYCTVLLAVYFLNSIHAAVVVYPLSVSRSIAPISLSDEAGTAMSATLILLSVECPLVFAFLLLVTTAGIAFGAVAVLIAWQMQETARRALMAVLQHHRCIAGDFISYVGQWVAILCLSATKHLSLDSALWAISCSSAVAFLFQSTQLGISLSRLAPSTSVVRQYWSAGKWVLVGALGGVPVSQGLQWSLAISGQWSELSNLQAINNPLGVTHPLLFGVNALIVPMVRIRLEASGIRSALEAGVRFGLQGAILLVPYCLLLLIAPERVLILFYGKTSRFDMLTTALTLNVLVYTFNYFGLAALSVLNGLRRSALTARLHMVTAVTVIILVIPAAVTHGAKWGLAGLCGVMLVRLVISLIALAQAYWRNAPSTLTVFEQTVS